MTAAISIAARQPKSVENAELQTSSEKIISSSESKEEEELVEQPRGRIHNLQENQASSGASGKAASDSRETSHIAKNAPETNSGFHLEGRTASGPVSLTCKILISEDGDTVWITFAKPSSTYSQYLSTDTSVEDAFLDIITYGPYDLDLKEEIEELCIVIHHALTPIIRELRKVQ
ncbi:hypothetical protein BDV41DRAFT_583213 [Aspergillus transmontanensis]|uniref:Uncharacterized protein n=1 Tax=Aspergillus transmontanensis TaxID=1034304 RepID=A0A5N6VDU9_9EURO|nr:hypothetical protein BDV41DRAFT_583213 [Aspergillus transmontanensis]